MNRPPSTVPGQELIWCVDRLAAGGDEQQARYAFVELSRAVQVTDCGRLVPA